MTRRITRATAESDATVLRSRRVSRTATPRPRASRQPSIRRRTSVNPDEPAPAPATSSPSVHSSPVSQTQQSSRTSVQPAPDSPQPPPASGQALPPQLAYHTERFRQLDNEDRRHDVMRRIMEMMFMLKETTTFDNAERDPVSETYTILRGLVDELETLDNNAVVHRRRVAEAKALAEREGYL